MAFPDAEDDQPGHGLEGKGLKHRTEFLLPFQIIREIY